MGVKQLSEAVLRFRSTSERQSPILLAKSELSQSFQHRINESPRNPELFPMSDDVIEVEGKIKQVLPGTMFRVELANGHLVLANISGKLRKHFIKITAGDTVKMEMSKYDLNKGRIVYRLRNVTAPRNAPVRSFGPRKR